MLSPRKKTFQKPNILRRKPKASLSQSNTSKDKESLDVKSLVTASVRKEARINPEMLYENTEKSGCIKPFQSVRSLEFTADRSTCEENELIFPHISILNDKRSSSSLVFGAKAPYIKNSEKIFEPSLLNVESFLNGAASKQDTILFNIDGQLSPRTAMKNHQDTDNKLKHKWSLELSNTPPTDTMKNKYGSHLIDTQIEPKPNVKTFPSDAVSSVNKLEPNTSQEVSDEISFQNITSDCLSSKIVKFKCDVPNCNKGFWSEQQLKKHKSIHDKQRTTTQITKECPVKNFNAEGEEEKCGQTFPNRNELLKHLNEDHTVEDALYKCEKCGRRFFWASGLRTHSQFACGRAFACGWPGCGRVFPQPCRLREHARAHTGDRPYPCRHPGCAWAFRSASKLQRHARRHTDERRHPCAACGRAFLRREHLRDHCARYHAPHARTARPARTEPRRCPHRGCEQTFTNMSTLCVHMRKMHRGDEEVEELIPTEEVSTAGGRSNGDMFLISLEGEPELEESHLEAGEPEAGADVDAEVELETGGEVEAEGAEAGAGRAARTHCTWPLAPRALDPQHADYTLEEDGQVEQSESSESSIYTIRSDLFLHGNVLINEDSEPMGTASATPPGGPQPLDNALELIDSHPTIDLMQEELMYADAAVDESSFRVFLLNGEELT